jgi:hypothetical protein
VALFDVSVRWFVCMHLARAALVFAIFISTDYAWFALFGRAKGVYLPSFILSLEGCSSISSIVVLHFNCVVLT